MAHKLYSDAIINHYLSTIRSYQKTKVPTTFHGQVDAIDKLLKDDRSAMIRTLYNFMVNAATVDYKFETGSENLDKRLKQWKNDINKNVGVDIPQGLRGLSEQFFKERWRSSLLVLNIIFEDVDGWKLPVNMWFADGGGINITGNQSVIGGYNYRIGRHNNKGAVLGKSANENLKVIIRKPYNLWVQQWPTPFMVGSGTLYHGLSKILKLDKMDDLMAEVIPLMFLSKLGSELSDKEGTLPTPEELKVHEKKIKNMAEASKLGTNDGFNAGTFPYDVEFKQDVPEIHNFINDNVLKPSDKNILSSMGMIEMDGRSRQETALNPKPMVQEVVDAVLDWRDMLTAVAQMTAEMNSDRHPKDTNKIIRVVPGIMDAFLTSEDKVMIRSAFDRGTVGHEDFVSILPFDWETTKRRRIAERDGGLDVELYPHVIMNQEQHPDDPDVDPESTKEKAPEKKKTEKDVDTAEIENFRILPRMQSIAYATIDDLPKELKDKMSIPEQVKFIKNQGK